MVFGEMGSIEETKRNATITAVGDVTVGVIDKGQFEKLLDAAPEDLRLILKALVERLRRTTGKMSKISVEFERIKSIVDSFS
ncbi:MAG: cyclic nucleotide-binding domain-containing protein [Nitrospinales bacterium]